MKAFISQPMRGKTDARIRAEREVIAAYLNEQGYSVADSLFPQAPDAPPLWYLGKALQMMSECDAVYFAKGWEKARGCCIEHEAAQVYNKTIMEE